MSAARRGHLALFAGLLAVSTSGPFFVMAHVDAFVAVGLRTLLAGLLASAFALARGSFDARTLRLHAGRLLLGGALLGGHFLLWIKAFELTDYASNLLLLVAQPIIAAVIGARIGEPFPRHGLLSLALALVGMLLIAGGDFARGERALLGDAACVVAAGLIALYYVVGRAARSAMPLDAFVGATLLCASLVSVPAALSAGATLRDVGARSWCWLGAIIVVTTLGGHGLMNAAAKAVSLFSLNLVIVLEPVVAIVLGAALFGARVTAVQCAAGLLLTLGVLVGLRTARTNDGPLVLRPHGRTIGGAGE